METGTSLDYVDNAAESARRSRGGASTYLLIAFLGLGAVVATLALGLFEFRTSGTDSVQLKDTPQAVSVPTTIGNEQPTPPPSTVPSVDGFVRYDGWSAVPGIAPPQGAWVKLSHDLKDIGYASNRRDVYDQPNGQVIGYHYPNLGFVSASMAANFDDKAARVRMWGCDIELDQQCKKTIVDSHKQPNLSPEQTIPHPPSTK